MYRLLAFVVLFAVVAFSVGCKEEKKEPVKLELKGKRVPLPGTDNQ